MSGLGPSAAVGELAEGRLVAFPTESSWGLGADASSATALEALRAFKRRDGRPISVLVDGEADFPRLGVHLSPGGRRLMEAFWPGPLTLVVACDATRIPGVANAQGHVGLRFTPHPVAAALARVARERGVGPITATSLNASGEAPCTTRAAAERLAAGRAAWTDGEDCGAGPASSVVDATGDAPRVLREAAIDRARIEAAWSAGR